MSCDNPYQSPQHEAGEALAAVPRDREMADFGGDVLTRNTIVPRFIAANVDTLLAIILSLLAAKCVSEDLPLLQVVVLLSTFLGYYLLSEGLLSRTPGKLLTGLVVVRLDGRPCSWGQVLIRTGFRVLEVNPVLFGAIPAAACIIFSSRRQRIGDMVAQTIVIRSRRRR